METIQKKMKKIQNAPYVYSEGDKGKRENRKVQKEGEVANKEEAKREALAYPLSLHSNIVQSK